jgi:predicted nucleic acid-binding protein
LARENSEFAISIVTHYQILIGSNVVQGEFWDRFFEELTFFNIDIACSNEAIKIYKDLKSKNKLIELSDLLIGATAMAYNLKVATLNLKHFENIKGIELIIKVQPNFR